MSQNAPGPAPEDTIVGRLPPDLAEKIADELRRTSPESTRIRLGDPVDRVQALRQSQQDDSSDMIQGPPLTVAPMDGAQARGAIVGAAVFGAIGLVIGLLIGLIPMFDLPLGARMGLWGLVGLMGASASGFVFGGGREPELEGELRDTTTDLTIAVQSPDGEVRDRAQELIADAQLEVAARARRMAKDDRPQGRI